jgi:hypothetical protein
MDPRDLRTRFAERMGKDRLDGLVFAVTTVLLTPVFLVGAIFGIFFALQFVDLPVIDHMGYGFSLITGINLCMTFMVGSYFMRPKETYKLKQKVPWKWLGSGIGVLALMLGLSYGTGWVETNPGLFWPIYGILTLTMLGLVGHAYEPGDDYYLGWATPMGYWDDFTTVEDDIDRAHFALGCAIAFPRLIMGSYGAMFGSTWLIRGLDNSEQAAATDILNALGDKDQKTASAALRRLGPKRSARIARALDKMRLVAPCKEGLRLTADGEKFMGLSDWH